jgi:hypothetical protein
MKHLLLLLVLSGSVAACSEHDCKLDSDEAKRAFGEVAGMTKGANHCFVSSGPMFAELDAEGASSQELAASHYDTTIDEVAKKYEAFLVEHGWEVRVEPHTGKRGNGESYEGKRVLAKKGDRQLGTIVYELGPRIIDTTTIEVPSK